MLFERSAHGVQLIDGKREKMMREKHRTTDKDVVERYMYTDGDKESGRKHSMIGPLLPWRFDSFGNQLTLDEIRRGIGADEEKRKEELEKSMAQDGLPALRTFLHVTHAPQCHLSSTYTWDV